MSGAALPRSALVWDGQLADGGLLPPGSECQAILSVNVPDKGYQLFTDTFLTGLALKRGGDGAEAVLGGLRFLTADSPAGMAGSLPPADVARLEGLARLLARLDNPVLTIQAAGADPAAALERAALVRRILQAARLGVGRVLLVAMPDDAPRTSDIRIVLAPQTMEALALLP
jgi:hypothetical protein